MKTILKLALMTAVILPCLAFSKSTPQKFKNLVFKIDEKYKCNEIKTGLFCVSKDKTVIVNLTIRKREKTDSLRNFKTHLEKSMAKTVNYTSKFIEVKNTFLNKVKWIYAKHFQSEFPGFYTQYYATVKGENAYLLSISYKKDNFSNKEQKTLTNSIKI